MANCGRKTCGVALTFLYLQVPRNANKCQNIPWFLKRIFKQPFKKLIGLFCLKILIKC